MIEHKYIEIHREISRDVIKEDVQRVLEDAMVIHDMIFTPPKRHVKAVAIAHSQVTKNEPLRFFVTMDDEIIINPVITRHTQHKVLKDEGCTTFPIPIKTTKAERWNKCEVEYYTIEDLDTLEWVKKTETLSGIRSQMFQHEIDHMDGKYVWDNKIVK